MTKSVRKVMQVVSVLTTIGSLATVAIGFYKALKLDKQVRKIDNKLDERLENSMDCSDATAVY